MLLFYLLDVPLTLIRSCFSSLRGTPLSKFTYRSKVSLSQIDFNLHMNNQCYVSVLELARNDMLIRSGILDAVIRKRTVPLVAGLQMRYRRSLLINQPFEVVTQVAYWSDRFLYLHQDFVGTGGAVYASALTRFAFRQARADKVPGVDPAAAAVMHAAGRYVHLTPHGLPRGFRGFAAADAQLPRSCRRVVRAPLCAPVPSAPAPPCSNLTPPRDLIAEGLRIHASKVDKVTGPCAAVLEAAAASDSPLDEFCTFERVAGLLGTLSRPTPCHGGVYGIGVPDLAGPDGEIFPSWDEDDALQWALSLRRTIAAYSAADEAIAALGKTLLASGPPKDRLEKRAREMGKIPDRNI
jgi:acyl-CoA thioesterase FadM